MKIAVVYLGVYPPKSGGSGADRRVRDMMRGMAAAGHEINMFIPRRSGDPDTLQADEIRVHYLGNTQTGGLGKIKSRLIYWSKFRKIVGSETYDWSFFYSVTIDALPTMRFFKKKNIGVAAEFCDLRSSGAFPKNLKGRMHKIFFEADERLLPKNTDLNVVISSALENRCKNLAKNTQVLRIPILVDNELFTPSTAAASKIEKAWAIPKQSVVFSYVGSLWKTEGVGYLVKAFAQIVEDNPSARLIIAGRLGETDEYDDIKGLVKYYRLNESVITPGWVTTDDVVGIYSRADVLVLPQINDEFAVAALPTKLAEYSNVRTAIIATNVGDVSLYFTDNETAILVPDSDVDALASAMRSLLADPEKRGVLANGAGNVARSHFDFRKAGARITRAMKDIKMA